MWLIWKYRKKLGYDPLTGVYNRIFLEEFGKREILRAQRYKRTLALILIDLDNLKGINDCYGHSIGDKALQRLAQVLIRNCRNTDYVFRYGGDEFLILMPEATEIGPERFKRRVKKELEEMRGIPEVNGFKIEASFGICFWKEGETLLNLVNKADKKLYNEKNQKKA
jgi:diguanylate cyclase (GGDEF)-like protein